MATMLSNITRRFPSSARPPAPEAPAENPSPSAGALGPPPVGLCWECEYAMWGALQAAEPDNDETWKSPYRRAREASEQEQAYPFLCESCKRTITTPPDRPTMRSI